MAVAEQAALALADTPVSVTVSCPGLVRTGMSAEGAEPAAVAAEALSASQRFWHARFTGARQIVARAIDRG